MNPGYESQSGKATLHPNITGAPHLGLTDFVVKVFSSLMVLVVVYQQPLCVSKVVLFCGLGETFQLLLGTGLSSFNG